MKQLNGGQKLRVKINLKASLSYRKREIQIEAKTIEKIKKTRNLSDRQMGKICRILRKDKVKSEPNTREFLAEIDKPLSEEYESVKM